MQRLNCTADLLFPSLWDETASGLKRSNTVDILHKINLLLPSLLDKTASGAARSTMLVILILLSLRQHRDKLNKELGTNPYYIPCSTCIYEGPLQHKCSSLLQRQSSPMMKQGANQLCSICFAPLCPRSSLASYQKRGADQLCSLTSVLLLSVP